MPNKSMREAINDLNRVLSDFPRVTTVESKPVDTEYGTGHYSTFNTHTHIHTHTHVTLDLYFPFLSIICAKSDLR